VAEDLCALMRTRDTLILAGQEGLENSVVPGRRVLPFLERGGEYYGPPEDDAMAIRELERMHREGARYLAFAWPAFWWFDYYVGFHRYLRSQYRCALENDRLVAFDLKQ
jgi:hypothetical protein